MHSTPTEHARCLYGDEYRPAPDCDAEHREHWFAGEPAFADAQQMGPTSCPPPAPGIPDPVAVRPLWRT